MPPFIDRVSELAFLDDLAARPGGQLYVLYGRRRVGKTALLREFCRSRPHIYFQAAQVPDSDNLSQFHAAAADALEESVLRSARFESWEALLGYLARQARERLVVVLDEFPYLCEADPGLPSRIQRFWDHQGQQSHLMLALSGSAVSFMENAVLARTSPLFGRRTGQQELVPLPLSAAAQFFPDWSPTDQFRAYGCLGGMPMYLAQFDPRYSFAENVRQALLRPQSLLYEEPANLLRSELRDLQVYNGILEAVAAGLTRPNEIAGRVGVQVTALSHYLPVLQSLRLLRRTVSITDRAPDKRSRGRYFLADNFLRFWYRFVLPNRSLLEMGLAAEVWKNQVAPVFDQFLGAAFEQACREWVRAGGDGRLPSPPLGDVGPFWSRDVEIDLLCETADGGHLVGECKWSASPVGLGVLEDLREKTRALPDKWRRGLRPVLFSRSGFSDSLRERAVEEDVLLVGLEELLGG
ncbi:MAG: ATP-binding protein [Armatimonadetes bacterium]|nr:ATP-binding protein [Armatimonadota bacterium]